MNPVGNIQQAFDPATYSRDSVAVNAERNLRAEGLTLPNVEDPAFDYAPFSVHNGVVYLAGQLAKVDGEVPRTGLVIEQVDEAEAARQMTQCALQSLARIKHGFGDLDSVQAVLHMHAYIACDHNYAGISTLADHASRVFIAAYGDAGRHPRSVLGVVRLPRNAPVMIDVRVALKEPASEALRK